MLNRLTFKRKMLTLPAIAGAALLSVLVLSLVMGQRQRAALERIQNGYAPALELSRDLEETLGELQRELQDAVGAEDPEGVARADATRDTFLKQLAQADANPAIEHGRVEELRKAFIAYHQLARELSLQLAKRASDASTSAKLQQMTARYAAVSGALTQGTLTDKKNMTDAFASVASAQLASSVVTALFSALVLAALLVLSLSIVSSVAGPLGKLTEAANRIARDGELSVEVAVESTDEVGQLARSFKAMVEKVREMHATLRASVQELSTTAAQLESATGAQTSALQRQAAGLAETSATAQEIKQTSTVAAAKAEAVLQVTVRAEELSAAGQRSVETTLSGLEAIRSQVGAMVGAITALSGRMNAVGEVIERVKDLADQSNILALNATIEATKAGEYGKSFAVVAREIRNLADQSLQSTARIREIVGEIQEAIRTTADGSSAGLVKVQEGTEQVLRSGDSLRAMMDIIEQSTQAARQIVAAVNQQNAGVAQISTAVVGLNEAMDETLGGVNRVTRSASEINGTSAQLSRLLESFRS